MAETTFRKTLSSARWFGALLVSLLLALLLVMLVSAAPRLDVDDIPELPMADGSGDTPEMIVKLVPSNAGTAVSAAKSLKLSSLRGKVTLLDMFLSQCTHCQEHAPHVVEWNNTYRARGLNVVSIARDPEEQIASVRAYMAKAKINYPVAFYTNMVIAYYADSHDHGVPQMVLFGADGKMVKRTIGWSEKVGEEMKQAIEEELKKAAPAPATVKPGSKATAKPVAQKTKLG